FLDIRHDYFFALFDAAPHDVAVADQIANRNRLLMGHEPAAPLLRDEDEVLATDAAYRDDWHRDRRLGTPDDARAHVLLDPDARWSGTERCLDKDRLRRVVCARCDEGDWVARDDVAARIKQLHRKTLTQARRTLERYIDICLETFWRVDRRDKGRRGRAITLPDLRGAEH